MIRIKIENKRSRTSDLQVRNLTLYPAELHSQNLLVLPSLLLMSQCGARGIRTPDTRIGYNSLAGSHLRPLGHRSKNGFYLLLQIITRIKTYRLSFYKNKKIRSKGDSNPRNLAAQRFSRPPHSTTLTSLQIR